MKPNFLVIGAPKAATTSLCHLLGKHPEVFMSTPKEPRFFSHDEMYQRGWSWYASLFAEAAGKRAIGEGSTSYSMAGIYPRTVERIVGHLHDVRIIYIVRDPFARAESAWMQMRQAGHPDGARSFSEFVRLRPNIVDSSRYWKQISAYRSHVPDHRILVLFFRDFTADPGKVLASCFRFLWVDPEVIIPDADIPHNVWTEHYQDRRLAAWVRRWPGIERLSSMTPRPVRAACRQLFRKRFTQRPRWDEPTRQWFTHQIADDVRVFLEHYQKPADYWHLDAKPPEASNAST